MMKLLFLYTVTALVPLCFGYPFQDRHIIHYELNPSPKLEKRTETEKQSLIHLKEVSKIDTDSAKVKSGHDVFDEFDGSHNEDGYSDLLSEKTANSVYQNKEAVRYEKRYESQRVLSQEIKHVPKVVNVDGANRGYRQKRNRRVHHSRANSIHAYSGLDGDFSDHDGY